MQTISRRSVARRIADRLVAGDDRATLVRQLAAYVVAHRLHGQIDQLVGDIEDELAQRGYVVADVTTAHPLDDRIRQDIKAVVGSMTGGKVELREHVDSSIIGGVNVKTSRFALDASVGSVLKRLKTTA